MASRAHILASNRVILGLSSRSLGRARRSYSPAVGGLRRNANARIMWKIDRALTALFNAGRRSVAILDAACGDGKLLINVTARARVMGFVAIEAKGLDRSPAGVARAQELTKAQRDPAIGLSFAIRDESILPDEDEHFDLTLEPEATDRALGLELDRVTYREGQVIHRN